MSGYGMVVLGLDQVLGSGVSEALSGAGLFRSDGRGRRSKKEVRGTGRAFYRHDREGRSSGI
jgi:hypothetical protein